MTAALFGPRWLRAHLATLFPAFPKVAICVAYSGGVDSTALLAALARGARARLQLRAVHINHGLQAGADAYIVKTSFDQDQLLRTIREIAA